MYQLLISKDIQSVNVNEFSIKTTIAAV